MTKRSALFLALLLAAAVASAQTAIPMEVEIGYRWLDLDGSEDMYRTQIDERSGLLLRTFTLTTNETSAAFDRLRVDADDLGAGPAGSLRIQAGLTGMYRLNVRYRRMNAFSALPAFANPLLGEQIVPGQHTFDRIRNMVDADVEILRWAKVTPFAGYSWNRYDGPGTTTYHIGQDEFLLSQDLTDTDREIRVGAGFDLFGWTGQITQGWRSFRGDESLELAPGANNGNNQGPLLGRPIVASRITREERTDVDTPFTSFYITGMAHSRVRLIGNFTRFAAESEGSEDESAAGTLASFEIGRFFTALSQQGTSRANNDTWRGGARAEIAIVDGVDLLADWQREHRELEGSTLINTLFLESITFGGADPRDVATVLNAHSALERDEDRAGVAVSARKLGPFSLRAGFTESQQDVEIAPDLAEISVPGNQGGSFDRKVRTFDVNGLYAQYGFTVGISFRRDDADRPILRTDYLDRDRYRLRAAWKAPRWIRAGVTAEETRMQNDRSDTNFDAKIRQYVADAEIAPMETLSFRASYSRFRADSEVLFRRPETFAIEPSFHTERGTGLEGGVTFAFKKIAFDAAAAHFENEGSLPFDVDRVSARVTFPVFARAGLAAEWARDEYTEPAGTFADYDATRYGLYLRLTP